MMISTEWLRQDAVFAVRPKGEFYDTDFTRADAIIDPVVARHGRLKGLMIDARGVADFDGTGALLAHQRFIHAHQPKVARIAVVGDQWWLRAASAMKSFYGTPVKAFAAADEGAAEAWLLDSPPESATVTVLPESAGCVAGVRITGCLRDADYPRLQANLLKRMPENGNLGLLVITDEGRRGWTPKECLGDIAMVFAPWNHRLEKLALVAGPVLARWCAEHVPAGLPPCPLKIFSPDEIDAAWAWLHA